MTPPSVPFAVWIWAAFDPVLVAVAFVLGTKADQAGKIFIAAIAALGLSLVVDALLTAIGVPVPAPLSRDAPALLPVRSVAALLWAALGFGWRSFRARSRP